MNKNFKRGAIVAASAAAVLSLAVATPSFAKGHGPRGGFSTTAESNREAKVAHAHATVAATITAVPTTVTDAKLAARGAKFVAYKLAAYATAIPATQPTTGGKPVKVTGTSITAGVLNGTLSIDAGAASTTTKYAIYNAAGAGVFVTVATDAAGVATATASAALTAVYVAPTMPAHGTGKSVKGDRGSFSGSFKGGVAATVTLPADGKTYSIRITETFEDGVAVATPTAKTGPVVTASGAITLPLGKGDTYKVELVAADGTVASTVTVVVAADGTVSTPVVL